MSKFRARVAFTRADLFGPVGKPNNLLRFGGVSQESRGKETALWPLAILCCPRDYQVVVIVLIVLMV